MTPTQRPEGQPHTSRKASKDVRRQQLIEATIGVLAQKGYASLTVADVARSAGLSAGIVIFHFETKEKLLAATLEALADEYHRNWRAAQGQAGPEPAARLQAILLCDFNEQIYTGRKLAAWIAFWGETQGRPTYDEICYARDMERHEVLCGLVRDVISEGNYSHDAETTQHALDALGEGLWLGVVTASSRVEPWVSARQAREVIISTLSAFFPRHFPNGRLA
jgi:TetR/AcrR family transcriptional repressor of bet genes